MERYDKYINTGVSWMPRIPSHWKYLQFRGLFKITKRIAGRTGLDVLAVTQRGIKVKDVESNEGQIAADYSNYQIVEPGDFAMNHMDLITGFVGISPQFGVTSPDYRVFKNISPLASSQFYLYIFELCYKQQIFYGLGHGVSNKGRWRLPAPIQNRFEIPLPPLAEQEKIVSYLEDKTSKINAYVADKEKEIELLQELKQKTIADAVTKGLNPDAKMKDSGISWIGDIPEHWEVKKIGSLFIERREKVSDKEYPALSVSKQGITPQLDTAVKTDNGDNRKKVCKNDFVVNSRSDRKGSCGVSPYTGSVSLINIVLSPRENIEVQYFHHLFRSNDYIEEYYRIGRGIVADLWTTRYSEMRNIMIPFPPLDEQQAIVAYINEKTAKVESLITDLQAEIEHLKEYKQRLIADCVTGQVNVQNETI